MEIASFKRRGERGKEEWKRRNPCAVNQTSKSLGKTIRSRNSQISITHLDQPCKHQFSHKNSRRI